MIREWGKKIVLVLNKADILQEEELSLVVEFVQNHAQEVLGTVPDIFPVSARSAVRARSNEDEQAAAEALEASGMNRVEHYIVNTLDEEERIRLKLLSPLGVAERLIRTYLGAIEERLGVLQEDFTTLDNIDQQLSIFYDDLLNDVEYHLNDIDTILRDLEERGLLFFDENLRLKRTFDLIKTDQMREAFEREVVGDVAVEVEQRIQKLIDWTVEKNLRLWQNITDYISRRRVTQHRDGIIGEVGGAFDYNRNVLIESVGQTTRQLVNSYDRERESRMLAQEVQGSLANSALTGAVGLGIGTALVALFSSAWLDVTGVLFATAAVVGGLFILPAKRRRARQEFSERIGAMRAQIRETVQAQFQKETDESLERIREAISPYTRFVRSKREQLTGLQRELSDQDVALETLRNEIGP
jgi:hypothetical protein